MKDLIGASVREDADFGIVIVLKNWLWDAVPNTRIKGSHGDWRYAKDENGNIAVFSSKADAQAKADEINKEFPKIKEK